MIGGGSGHYPAFGGYVGVGLADATVAGDVFASPSTESVARICRQAHRGGGIVLGFGNLCRRRPQFRRGGDRLRGEGIDVRVLAVTDDVASAPKETPALRRGVAGDVPVFKIAGAAAEAGLNLDDVERLARLANARTQSFGIAFSGCTLPGANAPLFTVDKGKVAVGLGIHGEPGIRDEAAMSAKALADLLVEPLLAERPRARTGAWPCSSTGSARRNTKSSSFSGPMSRAPARCGPDDGAARGRRVRHLARHGRLLAHRHLARRRTGAAVAGSGSRRGLPARQRGAARSDTEAVEPDTDALRFPPTSEASRESARRASAIVERLAAVLAEAEEELGRIDAVAGDGDHGQGMRRGSNAAAEGARRALAAGAGAGSLLAHAGDRWADTAGGTSGRSGAFSCAASARRWATRRASMRLPHRAA